MLTIPCRPTNERRELTQKHILSLYEVLTTEVCVFQLTPQAAVVKALGELDVLLQWMEEMK